ncbi:hypothetical protein [Chitinolyticbacter meiyuanensis]|uniref:hypothetical protein n=1 Tax=Chitinolyticbacter meiyuanensis TaxID=682798 RepID=UPI0011E5E102|nr:hypothetical protein [Chitinolyticbacter meiyuanensis]
MPAISESDKKMWDDGARFAVIGSGFGLYGYLPALLRLGSGPVLLPEKYRPILLARDELRPFDSRVHWQPSIEAALARADGVVLAVPPAAQVEWLPAVLHADQLRRVVLEKPLAPSPEIAVRTLADLACCERKIRVGYTFLYADWYPLLLGLCVRPLRRVMLRWHFMADHIVKNKEIWKRHHALGGGVVRFYGIHLLAVLASLDYARVSQSRLAKSGEGQALGWQATFAGAARPEFEVEVLINVPVSEFSIAVVDELGQTQRVYAAASPFEGAVSSDGQDKRVTVLERLLGSFDSDDAGYVSLYRQTHALWANAEQLAGV